jgi:hypothetical protein
MMELDIEYVEKKSLWLDIQILARTGPAILLQLWDVKIAGKFSGGAAKGGGMDVSFSQNGQREPVIVNTSLDTTRGSRLAATQRTGLRAAPEPIDG